jgi:hypothetical protein
MLRRRIIAEMVNPWGFEKVRSLDHTQFSENGF